MLIHLADLNTREMKKDGIPFSPIARFTKLSVEEIEKL